MLMILHSTLSVIRHLIYGNHQTLLLNLNLTCETLNWVRKWLVDFNAGKFQLVSFDRSNNTSAIDVKMDGSVLEKKSYFKILELSKTASKKIGVLIRSLKFLSPEVALYLYKFTIRRAEHCCHVRNGYVELLALHLMPFLNPWLIVEM